MLSSVAVRRATVAAVAGALAAAAPVAANAQVRLEAESFTGAKVVRDRSAHGGRALLLTRPATVRRRIHGAAASTLRIRARGRACNGRLTATVDRRRVGAVGLRDGRWRHFRLVAEIPAGAHRIGLRFHGLRRGCRPALRIDDLVLAGTPPSARPPAPAPPPRPQPTPEPTPPPPTPEPEPGPLPPSVVSVLEPDVVRTGKVRLGAALFWSHVTTDARYRQAFLDRFEALTPENEMKWASLQPVRGQFRFWEADALVAFAQEHGKPIHGHTLIWHGQTPSWVEAGWTADELIAIMREHIHAVVGHFKGRVDEWDVVNEPFNDDGSYRDNIWHRTLGPRYIELALRFAREADPGAKLFINEIGADVSNAKSDALFHLAETYALLDIPLDGIGFQNHTNHNGYPRRTPLQANLQRFASLGLEIQITEMDVAAKGDVGTLGERLSAQAGAFRDAALACHSVTACTRMTVWGVSDRYSWIGPDEIPLLLDADFAPKPAFTAVRSVLDG